VLTLTLSGACAPGLGAAGALCGAKALADAVEAVLGAVYSELGAAAALRLLYAFRLVRGLSLDR